MPERGAAAPLRVVHVVRQFSPCMGGLEGGVQSMAHYQRETLGIDARVVTLDRAFTAPATRLSPEDNVQGIPVKRLPWRGSTRYPIAPGVVRAVREADVVHVHAIDFFFDALAATSPWHGRPMIATTHGGFFHTGAQIGLKRLYFRTVTRASARAYHTIVACSPADAAMFAPIAGRRMVLIENGVDVDKFAGRAAQQPTRHIIAFGRFASHKRIEVLFDLLARLRRSGDWTLTVAGSPGDRGLDDLTARAEAAGVGSAVRFNLSPTEAELATAIGDASYFACASAFEGFGLAAVEAMSAGLLPVLSAIPPFSALIERAGKGLLFDPADLDAAAANLLAIHAAGDLDGATRARVMQTASTYAWPAVAAAYAELYQDATRRSTRTAAG